MPRRLAMRCSLPLAERAPLRLAGYDFRDLAPTDGGPLGQLMYWAYRGGVEDEGQTPEWHRAEAEEALSGRADYGAPIWPASLGAFRAGQLVGATVVTEWTARSETLLAFALVLPGYQGRGLGRELLGRTAAALHTLGRADFVLAVAEGNPAIHLYRRVGFELFTP